MAIWLDHRSKVIVQGMTGTEGRKHTNRMLMFGTRIVAGVTPGKGGQSVTFEEDPIPVFNTVAEAAHATGANVSVIFVPPPHAKAAVLDAIAAGIELVVVITEGIPVADTAEFYAAAQDAGVRLLGPNCPGIISPGRSNVGIIPPSIARSGHIGLVSKSGTLTYQMMFELGDVGFS
ncbi:MAG: CoA-binding protein, partial [Propioniciclava sp.]